MIKVNKKLKRRLKLPLYRYQRDGVRHFERSNGRVLNCDDMGLGKSAQAIGYCAIHPELRPILVVCPSTVKWTWQREWEKFAGLSSYVCDGEMYTNEQIRTACNKAIKKARKLKDPRKRTQRIKAARRTARLKARSVRVRQRQATSAKILIINYDIFGSWLPFLLTLGIKVVLYDECHYLMNAKAKRTKAAKELSKNADHVMGLSGTPMEGKPAHLFPILNMVRPDEFPSFWNFAFEYCAPTKRFGRWDFTGAANLDSLHRRLKGIMIRRMTDDVLKELPRKTRTVIPVDLKNREEYDEAEENFLSWLREKKGRAAQERARNAEAVVKMGALKQLAAEGKIEYVIQWIRDWLSSTKEKLIVFAIHKKIIKKLRRAFPKSLLIDGTVSNRVKKGQKVSARQRMIDRFQTSKRDRLIFLQLKAGGVGITLTSGASVLKTELGWSPGDHDQAEKRAHRIGQKKRVRVYYIVGKDTIEERVLAVLQAKDKVTGEILDGRRAVQMRLLDMYMRGKRG